MDNYRAWKLLAPSGLLCVGLGISVITDAASRRGRGGLSRHWFSEGAAGLVLLNGGLSLFGEAVKRRAVHDVSQRG